MAGRARFQAITDLLERRTKDQFEIEHDDEIQPTSLDYVCHWIESGKTSKALAQDLSASLPFELDYAGLMRYLRNVHGVEKVDQAIEQARVQSSYALSEEALDIVDAPAETSAEVARAASRARSRQWMAERYNQSKFGNQKQANIQVNIGTLHLDALRNHSTATQHTGLARTTGGSSGSAPPFAPARLISVETTQGNASAGVLVAGGEGVDAG